ncbi:MAG: OmpA family protein [Bacteroidota bacterium]
MKRLFFLLNFVLLCGAVMAQGNLIKSVYFGGGSHYIDAQQMQEIQEFIQSIPNIQHYQITVSSHTDNIGGKEYNQWLSGMRSQSVLHRLLSLQLDESRINIVDNGQINPLYDNRSNMGRQGNRRVDIILEPILL